MTVAYQHLRASVAGEIGVSEIVPSAAEQVPIAAVAVPYSTPFGRRVISSAFSPSTSPLEAYMASVVPIAGGSGTLIDRSGNVLAGGAGIGDGSRFADSQEGIMRYETEDGVPMTAAVAKVDGTPWRVVLTVPTDGLHAPVAEHGSWTPWALLVALAGFAAVSIGLLLRLGAARSQAAILSQTDMLTALPNRRAVGDAVARAIAHSKRHHEPVAVCLIDLDHFKSFNDTYGHEAGDTVLVLVADALRTATRDEDLAGRWGGEEFVVVLTNADHDGALRAAERIRLAMSDIALPRPMNGQMLTASVGVAALDDHDTAATLLDRSDTALYDAKAAGRNCVRIADRVQVEDSPSTLAAV